jgi:adenosylmethionine---8-amino-7-oxononanoate aminotransferase
VSSAVWHPFTQHGLGEPVPMVTHAEGAVLHTADGRRIVDAISSWWVTTHGHCHPRIMAAIRAQAEKLDQIIFAGWTHAPAEELAERLVALFDTRLPHVFYSDSGSTAVEVALKMALGYWRNRNEPRHRILALEHGYHGDTIGTMSVGARGVFNRAYAPLLFEVETIPFPVGDGGNTLAALERACRDQPAAFIVEPLVLGAGGMLFYSPEILERMRVICAQRDVLFIADEVMTGWGRTGSRFACDQANITPDILCLSKGLTGGAVPLAATLATKAIYDAHYSLDRERMLFHSSSYTANPIACAAALANLDIWRDEPVAERIALLCGRQQDRAERLPSIACNVRRKGTIVAFEWGPDEASYLSDLGPRLLAFFRSRDLLLRPLGNAVYVMPPYCIDEADLDRIYDGIAAAAETLR